MARPCSVCRHPQLPEITVDIANGGNDVAIAKLYGLGRSALQRHRQHVGAPNSTVIIERKSAAAFAALAALPTREEVGSALSDLAVRANAITAQAESESSLAVALVGLREIRSTIEAQSKLAGLVGSGGATVAVQNNINIDVAAVVRELIAALKPAPDPAIPPELAVHFADEAVSADTIARLEAVADADE